MKDWVFRASEADRGTLTVSMYEVTEGVSNGDRQTIRCELDLEEVIHLFEQTFRVVSYHTRLMR